MVQKAVISPQAIAIYNLEYSNVATLLSNALVSIPMETRGRTASTCKVTFNVAALATLNVIEQIALGVNVPYEFLQDSMQEISLPPGASVQIDCNTVNTAVGVCFWWRERFLEPAERI